MPTKFICDYCGSSYAITAHQCPSCGAPAPVAPNLTARLDVRLRLAASEQEVAAIFPPICAAYAHIERCYPRESAPAKKLAALARALKIDHADSIMGLYDSSVFGSARTGFALCTDGIYWRNPWPNYPPSKHWFLPWTAFVLREFSVGEQSSYIDFGRGDVLAILLGKYTESLIALFQELQLALLPLMVEEVAQA